MSSRKKQNASSRGNNSSSEEESPLPVLSYPRRKGAAQVRITIRRDADPEAKADKTSSAPKTLLSQKGSLASKKETRSTPVPVIIRNKISRQGGDSSEASSSEEEAAVTAPKSRLPVKKAVTASKEASSSEEESSEEEAAVTAPKSRLPVKSKTSLSGRKIELVASESEEDSVAKTKTSSKKMASSKKKEVASKKKTEEKTIDKKRGEEEIRSKKKETTKIKPLLSRQREVSPSEIGPRPRSSVRKASKLPAKEESSSEEEPQAVLIRVSKTKSKPKSKEESSSEEDWQPILPRPKLKEAPPPILSASRRGKILPIDQPAAKEAPVLRPVALLDLDVPEEKAATSNKEKSSYLQQLKTGLVIFNEGYDIYPTIKSLASELTYVYADFMNAPSNPIVSNLSYGFLGNFIPGFKILFTNLLRLGGDQAAAALLNHIGFAEKRLLPLLGLETDPKQIFTKVAKFYLDLSNPLGWGLLLYRIFQLRSDFLSLFQLEGGILGRLQLLEAKTAPAEETLLQGSTRLAKRGINRFIYGSLRKTLLSLIEDVCASFGLAEQKLAISRLLTLFLVGVEMPVEKQREKPVLASLTEKAAEYMKPAKEALAKLAKPLNDEAGALANTVFVYQIESYLETVDIPLTKLLPPASRALLDASGLPLEAEEELQWGLQELGSLAAVAMLQLLAEVSASSLKGGYTAEQLLTEPVALSRSQNALRVGLDYAASFFSSLLRS